MARRKNSTALFEVMANARAQAAAKKESGNPGNGHSPPPTKSYAMPASKSVKPLGGPGMVASGKKWFLGMLEKRRLASAAAAAEAAVEVEEPETHADPTAGVTAQKLLARSSAISNGESSRPLAAARRAVESSPVIEAKPTAAQKAAVPLHANAKGEQNGSALHHEVQTANGRSRPAAASTAEVPAAGNKVAFNRDKHEVTFRLRMTTAVISTFALLVVVGVAYIIGKRAGTPGTPTAGAPSTSSQIRKGPVQPGALDVKSSKTAAKPKFNDPTLASERTPGSREARTDLQSSGSNGTPQVTPITRDAGLTDGTARRSIGLNYCVIQSYPPELKDTAMEVRDFLTAGGLPCTIEIGSSKTHTQVGWFILVGTRGFAPGYSRAPEYVEYSQLITTVAAKFPQKSKFGKPQTMMVKWAE